VIDTLIDLVGAILGLAFMAVLGIWLWERVGAEGRWRWLAIAGAAGFLGGLAQWGFAGAMPAALTVASLVGAWMAWTYQPAAGSSAYADVTEDRARLEQLAEPFDPEDYVDLARGVFIGLDEARKPVYVPHASIYKKHTEIMGASGTGKSSVAGLIMGQLLGLGETVVVVDPKDDANLLGVLARMARKWGVPVHVLDLRMGAPVQANPFLGARPDQVETLLQAALELGKSGNAAVDFHRGEDREATGYLAKALEDGATTFPELLHFASQDERITEKKNLWREFRQLARLPALQAEAGLDLREAIEYPGLLYVIGSTEDDKVFAAQRLVLQRILQIINDRTDKSRPVCLFLDELKYILSNPTLRAAGTIRDRNCHIVFAHQSLGDLHDCPGLDANAVVGAVWGNSSLRFIYKLEDEKTAGQLEKLAGKIKAKAAASSTNDNGTTESVRDADRPLLPQHVFTNLPRPEDIAPGAASVGVVFGLGVAFLLSTRYLDSGPKPEPIPADPALRNDVSAPAGNMLPAPGPIEAPAVAVVVLDPVHDLGPAALDDLVAMAAGDEAPAEAALPAPAVESLDDLLADGR